MLKSTISRWMLPSLVSAALLASPLAMAAPQDSYGGKRYHGNCEQMKSGKMNFDREDVRRKMTARHNEIADRLQLTDEQRKVWDEIQQERQAEWKKRMQQKQERMEKHCRDKNDK